MRTALVTRLTTMSVAACGSFRVHRHGRTTRIEGTRGIPIEGASSAKSRRIVLALLLLTANKRWAPPAR